MSGCIKNTLKKGWKPEIRIKTERNIMTGKNIDEKEIGQGEREGKVRKGKGAGGQRKKV